LYLVPGDQADDHNGDPDGSKSYDHFEHGPDHVLGVFTFQDLRHHRDRNCENYEHYEGSYRAYDRFRPVGFSSYSHWSF